MRPEAEGLERRQMLSTMSPAEAFADRLAGDLVGDQLSPNAERMIARTASRFGANAASRVVVGSEPVASARVTYLFREMLGREPSPVELSNGVRAFRSGREVDFTAGLLGSDEFYQRAGGTADRFVSMLYREMLGRATDPGSATFEGQLAGGTSRTEVARQILQSPEQREVFVTGLYDRFLGRDPDPAGLEGMVAVGGANFQPGDVLARIAGSPEYVALAESGDSSIVETLRASGDYSTLLGGLETVGLDRTLAGDEDFLLLAPTNAAFDELPAGMKDALFAPGAESVLKDVLSHLIVRQPTVPVALGAGPSSVTLGGTTVNLSGTHGGLSRSALGASIAASNGTIVPLETVPVPDGDFVFLTSQIARGGTLEPVDGGAIVTLDTIEQTLVFTDRPLRLEHELTNEQYVSFWDPGATFDNDPPNAVLSYNLDDGRRVQVGVVLVDAEVVGGGSSIRYRARSIDGNPLPESPTDLISPTLFVDGCFSIGISFSI